MIQPPPATPDPSVPFPQLPSSWEHWRDAHLGDLGAKLLAFLLLAGVVYSLAYFARRQIRASIEDVNRRHTLAKGVNQAALLLLGLAAVALFADWVRGFGTVVGLALAGIAVALQDVLRSAVGWLYISGRSGVQVGSRVEVQGVMGDVIDVGVLKTTLLEVGNLVFGEQSTGRLVTVPNSAMLSANVYLNSPLNSFVWQEVRFVVTFESDWEAAEAAVKRVLDEHHSQAIEQLERGYRALERRYAFRAGTLTPIVYLSAAEHGVEVTARFLTHVRRRRGSVDAVTRRVLRTFAADPAITFAYPAYRVYPGSTGAADSGVPPAT